MNCAAPQVTFWKNLLSVEDGSQWEPGDWEPVLSRLEKPRPYAGDHEHPGWSAASFDGLRRSLETVRSVFALCLDYDEGESVKAVRQRLGGFYGLLHTTRKHKPEAPRFRVVLPLTRPVTAAEYSKLWVRFADFAGSVDESPKDASRFWYLPGPKDGGEFEAHRLTGEPLDPDEWLRRPEPKPPQVIVERRPIAPLNQTQDAERIERRAVAYLKAMDPSISGQGGDDQLWKAALALARGFALDEHTTFRLLSSEFNPRCQPPWPEGRVRRKAQEAGRANLQSGYLLGQDDAWVVTAPLPRLPPNPVDDDPERAAIQAEQPAPAPPQPTPGLVTRTMREILTASRIQAFSTDPIEFLTTAHWRLDDISGGIRAPDSWLIAGDTSFGKTSWLIAIADDNILHRKKRVLIVSTEDSEQRFGGRFMVRRSGVNAKRYRNRKLEPGEMRRVLDTEAKGEPVPVYVDVRQRSVEELCPELGRVIDGEAIDLIAFDYLQEFETKRRYQDERIKFKDIAKQLRAVGRNAKRPIPSIILSQLTLSEKTGIPTRANIRECKDVGNAADVIMIGFEPTEDVRDREGEIVVRAESKCIYVDKVKDGERKAKVPMDWNQECACFNTVADPEAQRIADMAEQWDGVADNSDDWHP